MTAARRPGGPYDLLYASRDDALWGAPGRLVRRAHEWLSVGSTVYDAGCGDGKNALFMQEAGFAVRGSDISNPAIARLRRRFRAAGCRSTGYVVADVADVGLEPASLDCLVSYGLLHCLRTADRVRIHRALQGSVRPGGLVLFSALLDTRALAPGHLTPGVRLVAMAEVRALFADHDILSWSDGTITEEHPPLVGRHAHDAVWVAARRVT